MQQPLLEKYLHLLGVRRREASWEALSEIVRAHLSRVPFENISKLYYKKHRGLRGLSGLEDYLNGIEQYNFGGTCYANNYYLYQLLANLGYQIMLCGADMSQPDVHIVSIVTLEGREYLVDVGYAAPFSEPMPRDLATDYVIVSGSDRYVLKPQDARGYSQMELYRDGSLKHGYVVKPVHREIAYFEPAITDSYRDDGTFMNAILLTRLFGDHFVVIHNLTVIESQANVSNVRALADKSELAHFISDRFGIPEKFTTDVLSGLGELADAWS